MPSPSESAGTRASAGIGNGVSNAGRVRVEEIQRARILTAMVDVASEHGLADATVARIVARAGVSRRTFYELFEDRESCFLAALDDALARASRHVLDVYDPQARWIERVRGAVGTLLQFLDAEPQVGRALIVTSLGAGPVALERRQALFARAVTVVDEGRGESKGGAALPLLTAEGVVGGALAIVHARLVGAAPGRLTELAGPLTSMIALPYLGPAAARRELARPVAKLKATNGNGAGDPLRDLGMRLTYRTVCTLMAVAAEPGSSNRQIGLAAGISDQGQISKLLTRLERLGLVHNKGLAPAKGAPNVWTLTARGVRVEQAMSAEEGERKRLIVSPLVSEPSGR
jgi:AcrR family transcriptional regulator